MGSIVSLSEEEIDRLVVSQAEDESAWEPAIEVNPQKSETRYLLNTKTNRKRLLKSIQEYRQGLAQPHDDSTSP